MKLYDRIKAPNARRVRWIMAEKGIDDIEIVEVDFMGGQHKTREYLAEVGAPVAPALILDDGTAITESVAIGRYLESLHPEPNLYGRDAREIALIEMWTRRVEMQLATPLMMAVRHGHPGLKALEPDQSAEVAARNQDWGLRAMKMLDRRLKDSAYLACDRITVADIVAVISIDFTRMIKLSPPPELEHLAHWLAGMRARPAAAAGM